MSDITFAEALCLDPAAVLIRRPGGLRKRRGRRRALAARLTRDLTRLSNDQLAAIARLTAAVAAAREGRHD